jgi:hypothetical protein
MERESGHVFETGVHISHALWPATQLYKPSEALALRVERVESSGARRVYLPSSEGLALLPVPPGEHAAELQRRLNMYYNVYNDPDSFTSVYAYAEVCNYDILFTYSIYSFLSNVASEIACMSACACIYVFRLPFVVQCFTGPPSCSVIKTVIKLILLCIDCTPAPPQPPFPYITTAHLNSISANPPHNAGVPLFLRARACDCG